MPPRRPSPKPRPIEQPSQFHRLARLASDWKAIVGFVLLACGGIAYALGTKFATKTELGAVQTELQEHKTDDAVIRQAFSDFGETQKEMKADQAKMMDWIRDIYQHPRK